MALEIAINQPDGTTLNYHVPGNMYVDFMHGAASLTYYSYLSAASYQAGDNYGASSEIDLSQMSPSPQTQPPTVAQIENYMTTLPAFAGAVIV